MAERRPMVAFDGTIHYGLSEEQKILIESHHLDASNAVVLRDDCELMLIRVDNMHFLINKGGDDLSQNQKNTTG